MSRFTCPNCQVPYGGDSIAGSTATHRYRVVDEEYHRFDLCQKCHDRWTSDTPSAVWKRRQIVAKRVASNPSEYLDSSGGGA